jgi:hypothetical protein
MGKGVGREEVGLAVGRGRRGEFDLCLQSYHVGRRGIDGVLETCKCDAIVECARIVCDVLQREL